MRKLPTLLTTVAVLTLTAAVAYAQQGLAANQFMFEGRVWTITGGGNGAPISAYHMTHDFHLACPDRNVKLVSVPSSTGGRGMAMTPEQRFRGDPRSHVECDRSAPSAPAAGMPGQQPPPAPATGQQSAAPPWMNQLSPQELARLRQLLQPPSANAPAATPPGQPTYQARFRPL